MTDKEIGEFEWARLNSPVYESFPKGGEVGLYSLDKNDGAKEVGRFMYPNPVESWAFYVEFERAWIEGIGWATIAITDPETVELRKQGVRPSEPLRTVPKHQPAMTTQEIRPAYYGGEGNHYEAVKVAYRWQLDFALGSTLKYLVRAGKKNPKAYFEDITKALTFVKFAIGQGYCRKTLVSADDLTGAICAWNLESVNLVDAVKHLADGELYLVVAALQKELATQK